MGLGSLSLKHLFLLAISLLVVAGSAQSETFSGTFRVVDGDTLDFEGEVIRLLDMDAPETGQKCRRGGKSYQAGVEALNWLKELTRAGVACEAGKQDKYGRWLGTCTLSNGRDLGQAMVLNGWAFTYRDTPTYAKEQAQAAENGFGVHAGDCEKPWDFRDQKWTKGAETAPDPNCPIKGNISKSGRVYHTPWSQWYGKTKITTTNCESDGGARYCEQWFCNEGQARSAGWRAPHR